MYEVPVVVTGQERHFEPSVRRVLGTDKDADPNYVPPAERSKKSTRHRVVRAPRARTSRRFEPYSAYPAFAFGYYCWYCDY
jgi:hypothetical protein